MVAEQVDGLTRLAGGLLADPPGVAPLQRHVLPQQQARLVGGVVELGARHVGMDAEQVEARLLGQSHVGRQLRRSGLGERHARRALVRPLDEEALTVDREHPLLHLHLAQPGAERPSVTQAQLALWARLAPLALSARLGEHLDGHVAERLRAQRVGPPQRGSLDVDGPLDLVGARGQRMLDLVVDVADGRAQGHGRGVGCVELGGEPDDRAHVGCLAAERAQPADAHRARVLHANRPPDASGVPVGVEAVPVLEDAGDVPLRRAVGGRGARHLHGQEVLAALAHGLGHVERVREEVALGVPDVGPVEPHVAQVEEALEGEPDPPARLRRREVEASPVEQGAVVPGERRSGAPVAGDVELHPRGVVEVATGERPAEVFVGHLSTPGARQVHGPQASAGT
jgi:hypothetical protein